LTALFAWPLLLLSALLVGALLPLLPDEAVLFCCHLLFMVAAG